MSIQVNCPECGKEYRLADNAAGKRGTCSCGQKFKVPSATGNQSLGGQPGDEGKVSGHKSSIKAPEGVSKEPSASGQKKKGQATSSKKKPGKTSKGQGRPKREASPKDETSGTKKLLVGLGGLVLLTLLAFVGFQFFGGDRGGVPEQQAVVPTVDPWAYAPDDATGVGRLDIRQLASHGLLDKVLELAKENKKEGKDLEEMLTLLNMDPNQDLHDLVLVFLADEGDSKDNGGVILSGRFDTEAIFKVIEEEESRASRRDLGDTPALYIEKKGAKEGGWVAIAGHEVLFGGSEDFVKKALALYRGEGQALDVNNSPLVSKASHLQDRTLWVSAEVEADKEVKQKNAIQLGPDASMVQYVLAGADFGDGGFSLDLHLDCGDADAAESFRTELQSALMMIGGMMGMFTQGNPEAQKLGMDVIQALKIGAEGQEATISISIDPEMGARMEEVFKTMAGESSGLGGEAPDSRPLPPPIENAVVSLRGLRVVGPKYNDEDSLKAFNYFPGIDLACWVELPEGGIVGLEKSRSRLDVLEDDQGVDLKEGEGFKQAGFGSFSNVSPDGKVLQFEVSGPGRVTKGGSWVKAKGTLVLNQATKKASHLSELVEFKKGEEFKVGDLNFTIERTGKPDWGSMPFSVSLKTHQSLSSIVELNFIDESGKEVKGRQTSTMRTGGYSIVDYGLERKISSAKVKVEAWEDFKEVSVPFDVKASLGVGK